MNSVKNLKTLIPFQLFGRYDQFDSKVFQQTIGFGFFKKAKKGQTPKTKNQKAPSQTSKYAPYMNDKLVMISLLLTVILSQSRRVFLSIFFVSYLSINSKFRKAVLISGGAHRFIFREANFAFENDTDVFIFLYNDSSAQVWVPSSKSPQVPYLVSENSVVPYFHSKGANYVHYNVIDIPRERKKLDTALGQEYLYRYTNKFLRKVEWQPHSIMLLLRHYAYMAAINYERIHSDFFKYSHFLYQREDNVYISAAPMIIPIIPTLEPYLLYNDTVPLVVASKYCPWGGLSDKIFFANRLGAEILFANSYRKFVSNMRLWVKGEDNFNMTNSADHMVTEDLIRRLLVKSGVVVETNEFFRTELRYVEGTLCIQAIYAKCGPLGFDQNFTTCVQRPFILKTKDDRRCIIILCVYFCVFADDEAYQYS